MTRAPWSLPYLVQFRPTSIESGDLGFGCGVFGNHGRRFLRASDVETGFFQGLLQHRDARPRSQNGGFQPFQFALLLESKLAWTRWLSCNGEWFDDPYRCPLALLALLQIVGVVPGLDVNATILKCHDLVADAVEEIPVMTDHQHAAFKIR